MYSRYDHRETRPIRLPENYGGTAFSDRPPSAKPTPREPIPSPRQLEIGKPSPPPSRPVEPDPPPVPKPPITEEAREEPPRSLPAPSGLISSKDTDAKAVSAPPSPLQGVFGHLGHTFPFAHGMGFDELLIIGLIILLSRNEQESDVVLWLALLLFCG